MIITLMSINATLCFTDSCIGLRHFQYRLLQYLEIIYLIYGLKTNHNLTYPNF